MWLYLKNCFVYKNGMTNYLPAILNLNLLSDNHLNAKNKTQQKQIKTKQNKNNNNMYFPKYCFSLYLIASQY